MEASSFGILESMTTWYGALLMGTMGFMSVYLVALAVVRVKFFRSIRVDSPSLLKEIQQALEDGDDNFIKRYRGNRASDPPIRILLHTGLANRSLDKPEMQDLMKVTIVKQRERLDKGLSAFGTGAAIGPFLGLLATVLGIIHSFEALAHTGSSGPNVVASGVAEALWGTAAGLVVAIPSVLAYNFFSRKSKGTLTEMELVAREFMVILSIARKKK